MKRTIFIILLAATIAVPAAAERLKDIVYIDGVIDNNLRGFGLVAGLNGTGDGKGYATTALANMMKRLMRDHNISESDLKSKNIALVVVTATMPAFSRPGSKIDVRVSSVGSASSLKGGELIETHLMAPGDNETVYALADGSLVLAGSEETAPTRASIPNGGMVVEEEPTDFIVEEGGARKFVLLLHHPDFTTADRIVGAILNDKQLFGHYNGAKNIAKAVNAGRVDIIVPSDVDEVNFISKILDVTVDVHNKGRVVINEATQTIVIGEGVTVLPVIISHGDLMIVIGNAEQRVTAMEARGSEQATPLQQIQDMLNAVKAKPSDIIAIILALKASGALQGEVIVR